MNGSPTWEGKILIGGLGIMTYHIFRNRKDTMLSIEFDPVGRIGRQFNFTGFCAKSGHYISNPTAPLKLRHQ